MCRLRKNKDRACNQELVELIRKNLIKASNDSMSSPSLRDFEILFLVDDDNDDREEEVVVVVVIV